MSIYQRPMLKCATEKLVFKFFTNPGEDEKCYLSLQISERKEDCLLAVMMHKIHQTSGNG